MKKAISSKALPLVAVALGGGDFGLIMRKSKKQEKELKSLQLLKYQMFENV